ncbi:DUF3253 domain-containing protein [Aestuariibius insulae]|uniref:DUF3253 domain-containing protein n=1 Tax=Aestuariibius insulae TaxID=2058287 RepID=UPI00345E08BA
MTDADIAATLRAFALQRGADKTFCPSEVARALAGDWRPLMPRIREIAAAMPDLKATQKGQTVDPVTATGPIRLSLA